MSRCLHTKSVFVEKAFVIDNSVGRPVKGDVLECQLCHEKVFITKHDMEYVTDDGINYIRLRFGLDEG